MKFIINYTLGEGLDDRPVMMLNDGEYIIENNIEYYTNVTVVGYLGRCNSFVSLNRKYDKIAIKGIQYATSIEANCINDAVAIMYNMYSGWRYI